MHISTHDMLRSERWLVDRVAFQPFTEDQPTSYKKQTKLDTVSYSGEDVLTDAHFESLDDTLLL